MEKNLLDVINKASWSLMETTRDAVLLNVTLACRSKQLDVRPDQMQKLLDFVSASVEEGYHRGLRVFSKTVEQSLQPLSTVTPVTVTPVMKSKKKAS
jgi:hypothetical protein